MAHGFSDLYFAQAKERIRRARAAKRLTAIRRAGRPKLTLRYLAGR